MKHTFSTFATLAVLTFATSSTLRAQQVRTAAGGRLGSPFGLSVKHFVTDDLALEGIASIGLYNSRRDFSLSAAALYHLNLDFGDADLELLKLYVGGGAGVSFFNYRDRYFFGTGRSRSEVGAAALNIRGYVGLQYAFEDVPLELTFDGGPAIYAGLVYDSFYFHYSLGVRYIISRQ